MPYSSPDPCFSRQTLEAQIKRQGNSKRSRGSLMRSRQRDAAQNPDRRARSRARAHACLFACWLTDARLSVCSVRPYSGGRGIARTKYLSVKLRYSNGGETRLRSARPPRRSREHIGITALQRAPESRNFLSCLPRLPGIRIGGKQLPARRNSPRKRRSRFRPDAQGYDGYG
ncbi:hypothetical protein BC826DRAFT_1048619 [Russula brevipes]|nr:hypothetical protein BC826DRAFT_1048619 [Russula brevipes]